MDSVDLFRQSHTTARKYLKKGESLSLLGKKANQFTMSCTLNKNDFEKK